MLPKRCHFSALITENSVVKPFVWGLLLFPLNSADRLRSEVIENTVNALNLGSDTSSNLMEKLRFRIVP